VSALERWLQQPATVVFLRWLIGAVLVLSLLAFVVKGADNPPDPSLAPPGALPALSHPLAMM